MPVRFFSYLRYVVPVLGILFWHSAEAVPSFARQTGAPCSTCHVGSLGPQLTPFGQNFKLGGYTMKKGGDDSSLPLSAMIVGSYTKTTKDLPDPAGPYDDSNNNWALDQVSLFVAGAMSEHVGTFAQFTYSDVDRLMTVDNVDVRYADTTTLFGKNTVVGVSLNNNPTVSDVWNTVPSWRFPYMSSSLAPAPGAATLINGGLEHQVIGVTGYGYWNNELYAELGGYKSMSRDYIDKVNAGDPAGSIVGVAPYWRFAYNHNIGSQMFMVGMFGLDASIHPDYHGGKENSYYDTGIDAAYQYPISADHQIALNGSYVHERQGLDYSAFVGDSSHHSLSLNEANLNASYYFQNTYGLTVGWFDTEGSRDNTIYQSSPVDGSRNGVPNSSGYIWQADWTPFGKYNSWASPYANVRIGVQYVDYKKFNGATNNYDGSYRDAKDNDTLYLFIWTAI